MADLTAAGVESAGDVERLMRTAERNRTVGALCGVPPVPACLPMSACPVCLPACPPGTGRWVGGCLCLPACMDACVHACLCLSAWVPHPHPPTTRTHAHARQVKATDMNERSSRSHTLMQLRLRGARGRQVRLRYCDVRYRVYDKPLRLLCIVCVCALCALSR